MKIVTTESLPTLVDNKTSITRGSAANSQGAKFESAIVLAFANLTIGQSLIGKPFVKFISDTIISRLSSGAISLWGKVGSVPPPFLVMPLTVEPSKPRLCNDDRSLNLWIKDTPFKLDSLSSLLRYVSPNSFHTICDDKSGYDRVPHSPYPREPNVFWFSVGEWYFTSNTIPFGWKTSAYIYHSCGLVGLPHFFLLIPFSDFDRTTMSI